MSDPWDFTAPDDDDDGRLSDLQLDRHYAGELDEAEAARVETMLRDSPADQARFEALDRHFDDIPEVDPRRMMAAIRRGADAPATLGERVMAALRKGWPGLLVLAGAAAAVVLLTRTPPPEPFEGDTVTLKGAPILTVQRRGEGGVGEPIASGAPVQPGDTIKFVVTVPERAKVRVIGVESDGTRYDAWPVDGGPSPVYEPGAQVALPGAVTLDDAPGQERLHLIVCPDSEPTDCEIDGPTAAPRCQDGCRIDTFLLDKRAP